MVGFYPKGLNLFAAEREQQGAYNPLEWRSPCSRIVRGVPS